jgi:hypothetical protein
LPVRPVIWDAFEPLFTYAFGSGLHQSRIGMYAPANGPDRTYEADTGYFGDLSLVQEDKSDDTRPSL